MASAALEDPLAWAISIVYARGFSNEENMDPYYSWLTMIILVKMMNLYPLAPMVVWIIPVMEWYSVPCMGIKTIMSAGAQL